MQNSTDTTTRANVYQDFQPIKMRQKLEINLLRPQEPIKISNSFENLSDNLSVEDGTMETQITTQTQPRIQQLQNPKSHQ